MRRTVHTAVQDRPHSLTLKRVTPCHSSGTSPCTRFGDDQRARNDNWQRLCHQPWWLSEQHSAAPLERQPGAFIAQPNHCCPHNPRVSPHHLVQLARAQFRAIAGTPIRNEHTTATRTASSWLHTMHRNSARMPRLLRSFYRQNLHEEGSSRAASH